jgi:hypothetical protein
MRRGYWSLVLFAANRWPALPEPGNSLKSGPNRHTKSAKDLRKTADSD